MNWTPELKAACAKRCGEDGNEPCYLPTKRKDGRRYPAFFDACDFCKARVADEEAMLQAMPKSDLVKVIRHLNNKTRTEEYLDEWLKKERKLT